MHVKQLQKLFPKKSSKPPRPSRDHNPFGVFLSTEPSQRPLKISPSSSTSSTPSSSVPSSPAVSAPPSAFSSPIGSPHPPVQKRSLVDHLFEIENEKLIEAFRIIDTNGDGKISEQELGAMWYRLGKRISDKELRIMIKEADTNGDGVLDLREFVAFFDKMVVHPEVDDPIQHAEDVRIAFDVFDSCRDGLISAAELQIVMKRLRKRKATAAECAAMIRYVDSDGDGLITFNEFEKLMMSSIFARKY